MVCLPERYIYGWIMAINSESEVLKEYQKECYDIPFNHFQGRFSAMIERLEIDERIKGQKTNYQ